MLLAQNAKRLAIFAYYDKDGLVDEYVLFLLQAVKKHCGAQIVIVNGTLTDEAKARVEMCADTVMYRENIGFDVTAYKEAFLCLQNAKEYDEILFYNQTIFGPVYPLDDMFRKMNATDVDFWGLTRHKGAKAATWDSTVPIPPHVQSYFFAVRRSMFLDPAFTQYWNEMPEIQSYWDAVGLHEILFTEFFSRRSFKWDVYVHTEDLECRNDYPMMGMPASLLAERGCPFFKRKSFLVDRHAYTTVPQGGAQQELYDFVRLHTGYPLRLPVENLMRTASIAEVSAALTLICVAEAQPPMPKAAMSVATVLYFAKEALAGTLSLVGAQCAGAPLFCVFATKELQKEWKPKLPASSVCIVSEQNGAQVLFSTLWDRVKAYEYLRYLTNDLPLSLEEFEDETTLTLAAKSLVSASCAAYLEANSSVGLLIPAALGQREGVSMGFNWPQLVPQLTDALAAAGIQVPLGETKPAIASRGGMFFARTAAVEAFAQFDFTLPCVFGGIYPAWECLAPLFCQNAGYLTASATTLFYVTVDLQNKNTMLAQVLPLWATPRQNTYDRIIFRMRAILDFYTERRHQMTLEQAFNAKLSFKQKIWICAQIFLKPTTFARLHKAHGEVQAPPVDDLD